MREHVDEVEDQDVEVVGLERGEVAQESLAAGRVVDFVVGKATLAAKPVELCLDERRFVVVFPSSLSSSTHRSGNIRSMSAGISPEKMAFRAYCVAVGRIEQ